MPIWLRRDAVEHLHSEQLAEHGGAPGLRDEGLLESALARPRNAAAYGAPSLFELAAACAFGIVRNHPFVDGDKRSGFQAAATFLRLNGFDLTASDADVVVAVLALADGATSEAAFAEWLESHAEPL